MLIAALWGGVISLAVFYAVLVVADLLRTRNPDLTGQAIKHISILAGTVPFVVVVAVFLGSPLVILALLIGHIFRNSIETYPAIWCVAAPTTVWVSISALASLSGRYRFVPDIFFDRFPQILMHEISIAILLMCVPPAALFYWFTILRQPSIKDR